MKYIVTINNKNYEVEVDKEQASIATTTQNVVQNTPAAPQAPVPPPAAPTAATVTEGKRVTAPMPGTILSIKANPGEKVKKGNVILILEAMKMENDITAPVDGVIIQITAVKGSSVSTGDILAVIQ